ncbi:hypothetical protein NST11_19365 [Caldifermentibacillus hisashii]|uniref:hypothetical protein n=1 Tax=Caldifermentibacillus hisashii TaxID=996558 RepID=UPI0031B76BB8
MINANQAYGKLHLILELIDRKDIRDQLDEEFTIEEQESIYQLFRTIMIDEIYFVMQVKKGEKQSKANPKAVGKGKRMSH